MANSTDQNEDIQEKNAANHKKPSSSLKVSYYPVNGYIYLILGMKLIFHTAFAYRCTYRSAYVGSSS